MKRVTLRVRDGSERPVTGEGSAAVVVVAVAVEDAAAAAVEMEIEALVLAEKVVTGETVVVVAERG